MAKNLYRGLPSNRYEAAILATWREASRKSERRDLIPFSKEDLVRHGAEIQRLGIDAKKVAVKNVPDIIYTYRARAELPDEILMRGHFAIVGCGKGLYAFAKISQPNRIILPSRMRVQSISNKVPSWVRPFMTDDEQGMLAVVNANDLVGRYLDLKKCYRIQSHMRMGVKDYGQVEVDELYVGETASGRHVGIAVEAKDYSGDDCLNVSQLFGTSMAVQQVFSDIECKVVGVKPKRTNGRICMCEFRVCNRPEMLAASGKWVAFEFTG